MNERQRERLLDRVERASGPLGTELPDELTVQGTTVDVTSLVFECERLDGVPPEMRDRVEETKTALRRERLERKQRLAREEMSYEEGERLVASIHGIDRTINALEQLDEPDLSEKLRQKRMADARELLSLIRQRP